MNKLAPGVGTSVEVLGDVARGLNLQVVNGQRGGLLGWILMNKLPMWGNVRAGTGARNQHVGVRILQHELALGGDAPVGVLSGVDGGLDLQVGSGQSGRLMRWILLN